jgi:hypothetical protein
VQEDGALGVGVECGLGGEGGLSGSRLARDQRDPEPILEGAGPQLLELRDLILASDDAVGRALPKGRRHGDRHRSRPIGRPLHPPRDLGDAVTPAQALELELPFVAEAEVAAAADQLAQEGGDEDFACAGARRDPRGEDHVLAEEVRLVAQRLPRVHPDPNPQRQARVRSGVPGHRLLHVDRTGDRLAGAREGEHEAVALGLDLIAIVGLERAANHLVVALEQLEPALVAELLRQHR